MVGVAWSGDSDSYASFVQRHSLTFPNIDDSAAEVFSRFKVASHPKWVFINQKGEFTTQLGSIKGTELDQAIKEMSLVTD